MNALLYRMLYGLCYAASLLPLRALYALSDAMSGLLYHIIRYRRRIVRKNLTTSFPQKSPTEIVEIEKNFYSWLCDYAVETVKLLSISPSEISERMKFEGLEALRASIDNHRSCAVYLGHYCNWEWVTSLPLAVGGGAVCGQIYHPLENHAFDRLFLKLRSRFGARNIKMDDTFRTIMSWKKEGVVNVVGYIADQVPGLHNVHCWVDFLHHDTPVFTGAEKINVLFGTKVFYGDVTRPKRGYYKCRFVEMRLPDTGYTKFFYTKNYFNMLETTISHAPQYWLWSHNRWKRTREQFNREFTEEQRKIMLSRL